MKRLIIVLMGALILAGCGKEDLSEKAPPVQIEVIAPSISHQMMERFGNRFKSIGKVEYDASRDAYIVEVFYAHNDHETRYLLPLSRSYVSESRRPYIGEFPLDVIGERNPQGRPFFRVSIDEQMNK